MVEILSDNNELERALRKLWDTMKANGATLDERMTIEATGGAMRVLAGRDIAEMSTLMFAPEPCLLRISRFAFGLQGDDLVILDTKPEVTEAQKQLMEELLAVYNLSGKIADYRQNATSNLYHSDPALLERLLPKGGMARFEGKDEEELLIDGFLHTRQLGYRDNPEDQIDPVLMPIIDLVNHHVGAANFNNQGGGKGLEVKRSSPGQRGPECFVKYGAYDALDMVNSYNFVDRNQRFVYVRPFEIELDKLGTLHIGLYARKFQGKKVPPQIKDLRAFIPPMKRLPEGSGYSAGFLRIPVGQSPRALRRVLQFMIQFMNPERGLGDIEPLVNQAEEEAINATRRYYEELLKDLEGYVAAEGQEGIVERIREVAQMQIGFLNNYSFEDARGTALSPGAPGRRRF